MESNGSGSSSQSRVSGDGRGGKAPIDDLLKRLELQDEEDDDLNFDEEFPEATPEAEFMAICRVHTPRPFSRESFYTHMRAAWSLAQDANFKPVGKNLFVLTVNRLGDWKRVTEQGPWLFRDNGGLIEPYDGFQKLDLVVLDKISVWIQLQNLLPGYRKKEVLEAWCKRVGKVLHVNLTPRGDGKSVRVRVRLDVNKPLTRFLSITKNAEKVFYQVYYEKIPKFCFVCGLHGHTYLEHGNGKHDPKDMDWGEWLLAPMFTPLIFNGSPSRGGRGGGVGRNAHAYQKRTDPVQTDLDLVDTASSPVKGGPGRDSDLQISGKKRLNFEMPSSEATPPLDPGSGKAVRNELAVFNKDASTGPAEKKDEEQDTLSQDSKRTKLGTTTVMDSSDKISTGSEREPVRSQ